MTSSPADAGSLARTSGRGPALRNVLRLTVSIAIGGCAYWLVLTGLRAAPHFLAKDFTWPWRAARALLSGQDPYRVIQATGAFPFSSPFFYPLPAAIVAVPVAPLPPDYAGALFFGASSALLAWGILRDSPARLLLFASSPFMMAAANVQWSPLLAAAALLPAAQWAAVAKPNLGLAAFVYRPSWRGGAGAAVLLLLSFVLLPGWLSGWGAALAHTPHHAPPVLRYGGPLLLAAALRWRVREGRLLIALALVPQVLYFYDQLMLWLVPRSTRGLAMLTAASWVAWLGWWRTRPANGNGLPHAEAWVMTLIFLPALLTILWPAPRESAGIRAAGAVR